jgi:adenylate cyclase
MGTGTGVPFRSHLPIPPEPGGADQPIERIDSTPTILLVDDDPDQRELFSALLSHEGYQVVTAPNAKTAFAITRQQHIDLVISDLFMPTIDGFNFIQRLRQKQGCRDLPIIAFTAVEETRLAEWELLSAGADTFCLKSETKLLLQQVRLLLE